jgi:periplasmic protein CpxP/Spy
MKRTEFLLLIIGLLVILNLATVSFIWKHRPPGPFRSHPSGPPSERPDPAGFMVRELGFDSAQQKAFETLRGQFMAQMHEYRQTIGACRDQLVGQLANGDAAQVKTTAAKIGKAQQQMELATYEHFRKVRALCRGKQKEKFDAIIGQTLRMMGSPPPPQHEVPGPGGPGKPEDRR